MARKHFKRAYRTKSFDGLLYRRERRLRHEIAVHDIKVFFRSFLKEDGLMRKLFPPVQVDEEIEWEESR